MNTVEAVIDSKGNVVPVGGIELPRGRRALITILDLKTEEPVSDTALLSEGALAEDWLRSEEDEAWQHLQ